MSASTSRIDGDQYGLTGEIEIDYSLPKKLPDKPHALYDDDTRYEVLCVGTDLTNSAIAALLTIRGFNVLGIDVNDHYGRSNASLNLNQLAEKFNSPLPDSLKNAKHNQWHIDTIPKVIMPEGNDNQLIQKINMEGYFDMRPLSGLVYHNSKIKQIPISFTTAASSGLISVFSVMKFRSFLTKVAQFDENDPKTYFFKPNDSALKVLKTFGFSSPDQISWACYAFALHNNQEALFKPAKETIANVKKYIRSVQKLYPYTQKDNYYSPFMMIDYGSGMFCEGIARKAAVFGTVFRLGCKLKNILYDDNGHVRGAVIYDGMISNQDFTIECRAIVADPELMVEKCEKVGEIIRAVFITKEPVPETNGRSCQIVVPPQPTQGKMHASYLLMVSSQNKACEDGYYVTVISTQKDFKSDATNMQDLEFGKQLLKNVPIVHKVVFTQDILHPKPGYAEKGIFITKGCDASTHFQHQIKNAYEVTTHVQNFFKRHNKHVAPANGKTTGA